MLVKVWFEEWWVSNRIQSKEKGNQVTLRRHPIKHPLSHIQNVLGCAWVGAWVHHHITHPCTYAPTHARLSLPVNPNPILTPPNMYPSATHYTAANLLLDHCWSTFFWSLFGGIDLPTIPSNLVCLLFKMLKWFRQRRENKRSRLLNRSLGESVKCKLEDNYHQLTPSCVVSFLFFLSLYFSLYLFLSLFILVFFSFFSFFFFVCFL